MREGSFTPSHTSSKKLICDLCHEKPAVGYVGNIIGPDHSHDRLVCQGCADKEGLSIECFDK